MTDARKAASNAEVAAVGVGERLLPCPFCGNAPILREMIEHFPANEKGHPAGTFVCGWSIDCDNCAISHREEYRADAIAAWNRRAPQAPQGDGVTEAHPDDAAVDRFAAVMATKLAKKRDDGRGGWEDKEQCSNALLSRLLREHVEKGDPVDVANLAMMIHQRGEAIAPAPILQWDAYHIGKRVGSAARAPKEGAPAADLEAVHDVAIQAYEAALGGPYSANALRKAVDAALEAALPFLPAQAAEPVAVKALQEAIQFLGWVATSYDTHGDTAEKSGGHPEEVEAYRGSAGMARDHAKALAALSGAAPQAGEDAKPEQWGDETVIADWWLIQNKHGQIVRGERTKDAAVNLDGGLWEGDIIIPVKRAVAAPPVEGWQPIETAPKDGTPILAWCLRSADPYFIDEKSLTNYGCHCEGLAHVTDGAHVVVWGGGSWESTDEYGSGFLIPDWWFRHGSEFEEAANPVGWMPLPTPPDSQGGEDAAD